MNEDDGRSPVNLRGSWPVHIQAAVSVPLSLDNWEHEGLKVWRSAHTPNPMQISHPEACSCGAGAHSWRRLAGTCAPY
jgi:hypothetical protein